MYSSLHKNCNNLKIATLGRKLLSIIYYTTTYEMGYHLPQNQLQHHHIYNSGYLNVCVFYETYCTYPELRRHHNNSVSKYVDCVNNRIVVTFCHVNCKLSKNVSSLTFTPISTQKCFYVSTFSHRFKGKDKARYFPFFVYLQRA